MNNLHEFQGDVEPGSVWCLYCKDVEKMLEPKLSAEVAKLKIIPHLKKKNSIVLGYCCKHSSWGLWIWKSLQPRQRLLVSQSTFLAFMGSSSLWWDILICMLSSWMTEELHKVGLFQQITWKIPKNSIFAGKCNWSQGWTSSWCIGEEQQNGGRPWEVVRCFPQPWASTEYSGASPGRWQRDEKGCPKSSILHPQPVAGEGSAERSAQIVSWAGQG